MKDLENTLVVTAGLVMGIAVGVLTAALGLALMSLPWELHFSAHHVAAIVVALTGITLVAQGVVVVDLLAGAPSTGGALDQAPSTRPGTRAHRRPGGDRSADDDLDKEDAMGTQRVLSWLIVLIGVVLAATPWILRFAGDHIARLDVTIGGVVVALLGLALIYAMEPAATRRLSH
jgi:SPW repeat